MRPINTATGRAWSQANVGRMYKAIRANAQKALLDRDRRRGIPESGQLYSVSSDAAMEDAESAPATGRLVVDRHLASLKHTGRELRLLTNRKWDEFCASRDDKGAIIRRDEDAYVAAFDEIDNKAEAELREVANAAAPDIEVMMPEPVMQSKGHRATGTAVAVK